jgi:hypothetical protein
MACPKIKVKPRTWRAGTNLPACATNPLRDEDRRSAPKLINERDFSDRVSAAARILGDGTGAGFEREHRDQP